MAKQEKDVVGLAKSTTKKTTTPRRRTTPKKSTAATNKAKAVVKDVVKDDLLELTEEKISTNSKDVKWLEEQIE